MPLPNLNRQCTANNRKTGNQCKNPAAFGCRTCRFHGARRKVPKGEDHPNYRHGKRTLDALETYRHKVAELDYLEDLGHRTGVIVGTKRSGRKPVVK